MLSSLAGDEDTVRLLIQAGANLDTVVVYTPTQPCFTQSCVGWTASCFATAHGHHNTLRVSHQVYCNCDIHVHAMRVHSKITYGK